MNQSHKKTNAQRVSPRGNGSRTSNLQNYELDCNRFILEFFYKEKFLMLKFTIMDIIENSEYWSMLEDDIPEFEELNLIEKIG